MRNKINVAYIYIECEYYISNYAITLAIWSSGDIYYWELTIMCEAITAMSTGGIIT
jgi:hypothetical protein